MSQKSKSTFVLTDPTEILQALVGLKDVRVVHYKRSGPNVELMVEQVVHELRCPACAGPAVVHERPVVQYVDLPVYGAPMALGWKKHRMRCTNDGCPKSTWVLGAGSQPGDITAETFGGNPPGAADADRRHVTVGPLLQP